MKHVNVALCVGGIKKSINKKSLSEGPNIVIGTPGWIVDLIIEKDQNNNEIPSFLNLNNLKLFVMDEADEMLAAGFF